MADFFLLGLIKFKVLSLSGNQFIMGSFFYNLSMIKNTDAVCIPYGRKTMCNNNCCSISSEPVECFLDYFLRLRIQCGCCFIKNNNRRILQKDTCNCNSLLLPARKLDAAFTNFCVIAFRKVVDEAVCSGKSGCFFGPKFLSQLQSNEQRLKTVLQ